MTALSVAPASKEIVSARDAAILDAVKLRPRSTADLLDVLPQEPGQTANQRAAARDSALIRLRLKKQIVETPLGWRAA